MWPQNCGSYPQCPLPSNKIHLRGDTDFKKQAETSNKVSAYISFKVIESLYNWLGMVAHVYHLSAEEEETGRSQV